MFLKLRARFLGFMNKKEKQIIKKIYNDCLELEKKKDITEYGKGQRDLCKLLLKTG